jgi:2-methylcitrate dehydratase PrpD
MQSLSTQLARWTAGLTFADLPAGVVANTRLRILDLLGVMIGSAGHETVAAARLAQQEEGGRGAHALSFGAETSAPGAALINGVASAVLEFDDTHLTTNIHPTGVILSACLPLLQGLAVPGPALIAAVAVGSEVACRLGLVSPVRLHEVGLHPTSLFGIFGAACAAGRLRGLTAEGIADALGTSASLSAGSIASFQDGTDTKTLHVGFAASAALRAVALTTQGLRGPAEVFEGKFGWYRSHIQAAPEFRFDLATEGLGSRWHLLDIAPKLYPCAYTMIPFIAAALALREEIGGDIARIASVTCEIMPRSFGIVCEPVGEKRRPRTPWHGRISLQHTVAEALVRGRFDKTAYSSAALTDPAINALADRVGYTADPVAAADLTRSRAVIHLDLTDGCRVTHTVEDMRGTARNPATEADYLAKFRASTQNVLDEDLCDQIAEGILSLDRLDDVDALLAPLRGNVFARAR